MNKKQDGVFLTCFGQLEDPRINRHKKHRPSISSPSPCAPSSRVQMDGSMSLNSERPKSNGCAAFSSSPMPSPLMTPSDASSACWIQLPSKRPSRLGGAPLKDACKAWSPWMEKPFAILTTDRRISRRSMW